MTRDEQTRISAAESSLMFLLLGLLLGIPGALQAQSWVEIRFTTGAEGWTVVNWNGNGTPVGVTAWVEFADDLGAPDWQTVPGTMAMVPYSDGSIATSKTWTNLPASAQHRFFRVATR